MQMNTLYGLYRNWNHSYPVVNLVSVSKAGPHRGSIAPKFLWHSQKKTNTRMRHLIAEITQRDRDFPQILINWPQYDPKER